MANIKDRVIQHTMQTPMKRITIGFTVLAVTFCVATVVYMLQGDTLIEATYMVVITLFSVGYGEIGPVDTPAARLFTMLVIVVGCSSVLYVSGGFIQMVMEGEIDKKLGDRKRAREIGQLTGHAIICGFGRIGQIIARELKLGNHPFVILEQDEDRVEAARLRDYMVIEGDATDERYLSEARVEQAATLATVLPNDAVNVFITLSARNMNPQLQIMARGEAPSTEKKLRQAGADQVVLPAAIGGLRIASMIAQPTTAHLLDNLETKSGLNDDLTQLGVQLIEIQVSPYSKYVNNNVGFVEHERDHPHLVVAIRHPDGSFTRHPEPSKVINVHDTLVLIEHVPA